MLKYCDAIQIKLNVERKKKQDIWQGWGKIHDYRSITPLSPIYSKPSMQPHLIYASSPLRLPSSTPARQALCNHTRERH